MSGLVSIWPFGATLGEGPVWDARCGALLFVDIRQGKVHRHVFESKVHDTWSMDEPIGWIVPRAQHPGFIAGLKSGFAMLTLEPFTCVKIGAPESDRPGNRLNDAKTDAAGRIWAGSMDDAERQPSGALYRLDPDFSWTRMDDNYRVTNGPTFSPRCDALYHADSARRVVYKFDLTPGGALQNRQEWLRFEDEWGYPDGMTTDLEGGVWVAHWDGGRVSRFSPDGKLDRSIQLPVSRPTSCAFGGPEMDRLFVTSAALGRAHEPLGGALFELDVGVRGAPTYAFGG